MPQGLLLGAGVSALTVLALILVAIIFAKRRKNNVNAPFVYVPVVVETEEETVDGEISEEPVNVEIDIPEEAADNETLSEETPEEVSGNEVLTEDEISIIEEEIEKIKSEETTEE